MVLVQKELYAAYIGEWYVAPTSISLDKSSISLTTVWQTEQLTATILPADARQTVTWTSSNTSIATVSSSWLVTCVTPWSCTITATTINWLTATCAVAQWWARPSTLKWWYWKLDGNMNDSSWNWHNGSWTGNYVTWHNWQWQSVSSASYRVQIPNSSELYMTNGEKFSFGFWIKPVYGSWTGSTYWVISMTTNIDYNTWWSIHNDSGSRNRQFRTHASWWSLQSTQLSSLTWSTNEWFHFVITYDWSKVYYYKNWTLLNSFNRTVGNCTTTDPLYIWYATTWSAYWNAVYDDVFYMKNYCLSASEISMIYSNWIVA